MGNVKILQAQHTQLQVTGQMPAPCSLKRLKCENQPLVLHLHKPGGGPAKTAITLLWTRGLRLVTLRLDTVHGHVWLAHNHFLKNIMISCQHLKTKRFYIEVWVFGSP